MSTKSTSDPITCPMKDSGNKGNKTPLSPMNSFGNLSPTKSVGKETQQRGERVWIRPDLPSKCTWQLGMDSKQSPHHHLPFPR
eukprot:Seg3164.2 transcript_id=Seg3164.2/GoldUCD/mRNA.D3Y31 product="hypothetical protein" protein_id=Seg3164.2/GoldUCD/D3Y31